MLEEKSNLNKNMKNYHIRQSVIPDCTVKLRDIYLSSDEDGVLDEIKSPPLTQEETSSELQEEIIHKNQNIISVFSTMGTVPIIYRKHLLVNLKSA